MDSIFEDEDVETELDQRKVYKFPNNIVIRKFENKNLVIYTEGVLWLVFDDDELRVFKMLYNGGCIEDALAVFDEDTVISVVSQIEAKHFEHPIINRRNEKNIYIYLTNNCNERCRHCYMYAGDFKVEELQSEVWVDILRQFKGCGGNGVTFTGGEITVYNGYKTVIKEAHNLGLKVTVLSNGIMWSENDIKEISNYIDEIQISIDGYDKQSYKNVRMYDGFDKALTTLKQFCSYGVRSSMAVTPLYDGLDDFVINFEPFAKGIMRDYPEIYIRFNLELIDGRDIRHLNINNERYREKIKGLVDKLYPGYYIESFPLNYENHCLKTNCGFGEIAIAANGDVFWCNRIYELSSRMNIQTTDFATIMRESEKMKISTDVDHSCVCKNCEVRYICGGDCRINYEGIKEADSHKGLWKNICPKGTKESIYQKMILCNEYFFEE